MIVPSQEQMALITRCTREAMEAGLSKQDFIDWLRVSWDAIEKARRAPDSATSLQTHTDPPG